MKQTQDKNSNRVGLLSLRLSGLKCCLRAPRKQGYYKVCVGVCSKCVQLTIYLFQHDGEQEVPRGHVGLHVIHH